MMPKKIVELENFQESILDNLPEEKQAEILEIFENYGENLSADVTNVFLYAIEQKKVDEVLEILKKYYEKDLSFEHPEVRGNSDKTAIMFIRIYEQTLGLQPA